MNDRDVLAEIESRLRQAVSFFWATRDTQRKRQGASTGRRDAGDRTAVTGGRHCGEFAALIRELMVSCGLPDSAIHDRRNTQLPGYFRATKDWDLIAVVNGQLVAAVEFKSQVGSFGNNFNNRTEEALGNATDIWTAYREGAFKGSQRPWLGYFMLLEDAPKSTQQRSRFPEPHFEVFSDFKETSYADRYGLLCRRLVRERLYDSACLLLSSRTAGQLGDYREPDEELSFRRFATQLVAHVTAFVRLNNH
jgi:hypothetical protein